MTTLKPVSLEFDQVVEGSVDIKQLSKKKYKITFSEISKFLLYQVWSDSSQPLNDNRTVYYQKAKKWVQLFNSLNESLKASNKLLFNPTTVMEVGNKKYLFVLDKAKLNGKGHVVFKVSTEGIKLSEKKMLKLPCGHHDGARFDIDATPIPPSSSIVLGTPLGLASSWPVCFCWGDNTCPDFSNGPNNKTDSWTSYGYSTIPWTIFGLGADLSNINVGAGYLFVYMKEGGLNCEYKPYNDQGPAQLVTVCSASQINALNNSNASIGGSLSKYILNSLSTGQTQKQLLPNLIFDEQIYYIEPTPLNFTSIPQIPLLAISSPGIPIAVLTSCLSSTIYVSLTNISITNNTCGAIYYPVGQYAEYPFIYIHHSGSFTFNATQPFYENVNENVCYLETQLSTIVYITE